MARILVVDDDPAIRKIVADRLRSLGHDVEKRSNGVEALRAVGDFDPDLAILDLRMPELDGFGVLEKLESRQRPAVVVITAHGSIEAAVRALRSGAVDFIPKPFDSAHLEHVVSRALDGMQLRGEVRRLQEEISSRHVLVATTGKTMNETLKMADRAANSESSILLTGESGTGKEVLARYIHRASPRSAGPFVAVNCAALSSELLESDLFGHEKGAFTGAAQAKPGRIEIASGGTLFLDEIAELAPSLQPKLLRVLQERELDRVGGTRPVKTDVRVISATHQNLAVAIESGRFRQDLYYRLNVVGIDVPPLRERREDLPSLIDYFIGRVCKEAGRATVRMSDEARDLLLRYSWPGNVRELSNVIERAVVLAEGSVITVEDLPEELRDGEAADVVHDAPGGLGYHEAVRRAKREIIARALKETGGHQTNAAKLLGLSQPYLARLIKNLGVRETN